MKKIILILMALSFYAWGNDYASWLKEEQNSFKNYKKSLDEEFSAALKKDWEAFNAMYTPNAYVEPKPITLPTLEKEQPLDMTVIDNSPLVDLTQEPLPQERIPEEKIIKEAIKIDISFKKVAFNFYSKNIEINYNPHIGFLITSVSKDSIANVWARFSNIDNTSLLSQIHTLVNQYHLNDWATYLLVHKIGMEIYKTDNMANLFTWYVLTQMNYDVKVGYSDQNIYLLSNMQHNLFQVAFLNIEGKKYYVLTPKGKIRSIESIYTYKALHSNAKNALSFAFKQPLLLNSVYNNKALHFTYNNQSHTLETKYSSDLVAFYKTFPQSDYSIYFHANNSSLINNSLLVQLKALLKNKTEIEAVNMLLRFTQTAFAYQTDKEQFNYEKVFFPEETFFYPYSDCEDRTILFSYLVKHILGLEVLGLKYSDHMAAAVKLSNLNPTKLDGFIYKNNYYTIADPTYMNANIGMSMPEYKHKKFDIIK
ncbi:MAG: hypothetical protein WC149_00665 [Arcobacteraceae bacterium]